MNLPVAPFYVMPPDKAAAIKILLYQLTAGWCKVGYSTPMNVKLSKTPPFTNPPNVTSNPNRPTLRHQPTEKSLPHILAHLVLPFPKADTSQNQKS
jgi:hypothetical protein